MKKTKINKQSHTPNTKLAMGDYYGQAIKNPTARSIDVSSKPILSSKKVGKAPKSLA